MVPRTGGYAYDVGVWDLSIVQGPVSVAPCQTLALRFATFASLQQGSRGEAAEASHQAAFGAFVQAMLGDLLYLLQDSLDRLASIKVPTKPCTVTENAPDTVAHTSRGRNVAAADRCQMSVLRHFQPQHVDCANRPIRYLHIACLRAAGLLGSFCCAVPAGALPVPVSDSYIGLNRA